MLKSFSVPAIEIRADTGEVESWPSERYGWFLVLALLGAYTFSFVDRQILTLMVDPIRRTFGISDSQFSLLHGLAFALLYTLLGLPFGRLVDHSSRRVVIAAGVFSWSLMTVACGLARSFPQLFLARVGVGVGEATLSPAAYSLLSDCFAPHRRARPLSVYALGISVGAGLAYIGGGMVVDFVSTAGARYPFMSSVAPWQAVFIVLGLPGMLFAILFTMLREPPRRNLDPTATHSPAVADLQSFLHRNRATFITLFLGLALMTALSHGVFAWVPTYFIRHFGWSPGRFGVTFGVLALSLGSAGIASGGWLAEWFEHRGRSDGTLRVATLGSSLCVPLALVAPFAPTPAVAVLSFGLTQFFLMMPWGVAGAAIQAITPNQYRGQLTAIYLFTINLIGLGLGPTVVALYTDRVFHSDAAVGWSLAATVLTFGPAGCALLWLGLSPFRRSAAKANAWRDR